MAKEKIQSAGGIGESKVFCAPADQRVPSHEDRILGCHINGVAIRELNLGPEVVAALDYFATDEGQAEKAARPNVVEPSGISIGADPFDKSLQQKRDDVKSRGMDLFEARDPLREAAQKYAAPGMKPKFLSAKRVQENGGTGDYEVVKQENGDPVKVRGMILGQMPVERAEARNKHFRDRANTILKQ